MGSNFFHTLYDPIGSLVSKMAPNSTVGKIVENDPLNKALGTENGTYGSGSGFRGTVMMTPNSYAGVPATLAAANTGYGTLPPQQSQQQQPRPVGGGQPQAPFSFNVPGGAARGGGSGGGW